MNTLHEVLAYHLFATDIVTFFVYSIDKDKAKKEKLRITGRTKLRSHHYSFTSSEYCRLENNLTKWFERLGDSCPSG